MASDEAYSSLQRLASGGLHLDDEDVEDDEHFDYVEQFAKALERLRQGELSSGLVEEFETIYRCFEEREKDFHAAVEVGQMLVEKNKQLMDAAEQTNQPDESAFQVEQLKMRNKELQGLVNELEVKRDLFRQKYRALEEARDKLLEHVKELEEEQRNNRLEIKANANAKRENRRLTKKLEQYKEEIQELMAKHEKMQKQNTQLRNDLLALKEKHFSPEDRRIMEAHMQELESENKELRTIKEAYSKLKDAFAKLEIENLQLRNATEQNTSLKNVIENLTKLDSQRKAQLEQQRTLLEEARNTIAFLKQILDEKGIVYDISTIGLLSKGMTGSKWSLMEELERKLLEILQDKSKTKDEMKEAILAEIGNTVARMIELQDERERTEGARELAREHASRHEKEIAEDHEGMDEMLRQLNDSAANPTAIEEKEEPNESLQPVSQASDANEVAQRNKEESEFAEKLRQKIADGLRQSKEHHFSSPLEWARFVQATIDEWKRDVEEFKQQQQRRQQVTTVVENGSSVSIGADVINGSADEPKGSKKRKQKRRRGKKRYQDEPSKEKAAHKASPDAYQQPSSDELVVELVNELEPADLQTPQPVLNEVPQEAKSRVEMLRRPKLERVMSLGEEMLMSLSRESDERRKQEQEQELATLKSRVQQLQAERAQWQRDNRQCGALTLECENLRVKFHKAREEWDRKRTALTERIKIKEDRLGTTRKVLEEKKKAIEELTKKLESTNAQVRQRDDVLEQLRKEIQQNREQANRLQQMSEETVTNCRTKDAEIAREILRRSEVEADLLKREELWSQERQNLQTQVEAMKRDMDAQLQSWQTEKSSLEKELIDVQRHSDNQKAELRQSLDGLEQRCAALELQTTVTEQKSRACLEAKDQVIADLQQRVDEGERSLGALREELAAQSGKLKFILDNETLLHAAIAAKSEQVQKLEEACQRIKQQGSDAEEEKINLENQIKRLEDMLHSLIEEVDKKRVREEQLLDEIQEKDKKIKELEEKVERLQQLLDRRERKRRLKKTHSLRLQRELVETQQALEEQQRKAEKIRLEMEQQEEEKRNELQRIQRELEIKNQQQLAKEKERMDQEKEQQRQELEKKHQQAGKAKESELLSAFAAAAREQVDIAFTLAREAEVLVARITDIDKQSTAVNSVQQLKERSKEVIDLVEEAASNPGNLQMQQALMLKQRELGLAIQQVVIHTTTESAAGKTELQLAVEAMATASGAGVSDAGMKNLSSDDTQVDNITVMAAAQEAIREIEVAFSVNSATNETSTLVGRILEKVKHFARLLKQVAAKTDDPKFKKDLLEYSNILPDRAIQLKIIAAVKSSSRDESSQLSSAAQGLKISIQEVLEILSVASLKKGLAATINQVSALKSLMSAWKNSHTLVFTTDTTQVSLHAS